LYYRINNEGATLSRILTKIKKSDNLKSAVAIAIVVAVVLGFFIGLRLALNTDVPVRVVESGSMCVPYDGACNGWSHPFDQTLHVGDIIIIQAIAPEDLNTSYPFSDIIVYQNPANPKATPIVHRIVAVENIDGILYFQTKGDGNGQKWPATPSPQEYDSNTLWNTRQGVPENLVIGKVVMRIPWFGWVTLFLRSNQWGLPVIISLIMLLIVVEFVIPIVREKKKPATPQEPAQDQSTNPFI
jgi:signal peptidase I